MCSYFAGGVNGFSKCMAYSFITNISYSSATAGILNYYTLVVEYLHWIMCDCTRKVKNLKTNSNTIRTRACVLYTENEQGGRERGRERGRDSVYF